MQGGWAERCLSGGFLHHLVLSFASPFPIPPSLCGAHGPSLPESGWGGPCGSRLGKENHTLELAQTTYQSGWFWRLLRALGFQPPNQATDCSSETALTSPPIGGTQCSGYPKSPTPNLPHSAGGSGPNRTIIVPSCHILILLLLAQLRISPLSAPLLLTTGHGRKATASVFTFRTHGSHMLSGLLYRRLTVTASVLLFRLTRAHSCGSLVLQGTLSNDTRFTAGFQFCSTSVIPKDSHLRKGHLKFSKWENRFSSPSPCKMPQKVISLWVTIQPCSDVAKRWRNACPSFPDCLGPWIPSCKPCSVNRKRIVAATPLTTGQPLGNH